MKLYDLGLIILGVATVAAVVALVVALEVV
jgi:hypothetical protein